MTWREEEYVDCLESERRRYAWVMRRYGGLTPARAWEAAMAWYPFEASDDPYRGLVFHDEAWHWAMLALYGERYAVDHPELTLPSTGYNALD